MPDRRKMQSEIENERVVRIIAGPFAGSAGTLVSTTPNGTAEVRLTVAGEEVVVQMPLTDCTAIH